MREQKEVVLDVDNVLTDYHVSARSLILDMFGREIPPSAFTHWNATLVLEDPEERKAMMAALGKPGFCSSLIPDPEAVEAVKEMRKEGALVVFATAPHPDSPSWKDERELWLVRHFEAEPDDVIHIRKKYLLNGDVFVDDVPEHVKKWAARNPRGRGMTWKRLYNQGRLDVEIVSSWKDVLRVVRA